MKVLEGKKEKFNIKVEKFVFKTEDKENSDEKMKNMMLNRIKKISELLFYNGNFIISTILLSSIKDYIQFDIYIKEEDELLLFNIDNFNIENSVLRRTVFNFIIKTIYVLFKKQPISVKNVDRTGWKKYRLFIVNNDYYFDKQYNTVKN